MNELWDVCCEDLGENWSCYNGWHCILLADTTAGIILWMRPANERWRYTVTPSLIGWAHTQYDPCPTNERWWFTVTTSLIGWAHTQTDPCTVACLLQEYLQVCVGRCICFILNWLGGSTVHMPAIVTPCLFLALWDTPLGESAHFTMRTKRWISARKT